MAASRDLAARLPGTCKGRRTTTARVSPLKGALSQKQNAAGGFFLGTNQSGAVYFGRPENFPLLFA